MLTSCGTLHTVFFNVLEANFRLKRTRWFLSEVTIGMNWLHSTMWKWGIRGRSYLFTKATQSKNRCSGSGVGMTCLQNIIGTVFCSCLKTCWGFCSFVTSHDSRTWGSPQNWITYCTFCSKLLGCQNVRTVQCSIKGELSSDPLLLSDLSDV